MTYENLKRLNEELDAFNATLNDENEDTPELLAEQERLLNAVIAAEAADLTALSAKELVAHHAKRAPGQHLPKGLAKPAIIARITKLPPLAAPEPTPAAAAAPSPSALPPMRRSMASMRVSCANGCAPVDCELHTPLSR